METQVTAPPRKSHKRLIIGIVLVVAALLLLTFLCSPTSTTKSAKVTTAAATRATIEKRIEVDGKVIPVGAYSLAFPIPPSDIVVGPNIASVNVAVGSQVGAGQVLAQLEGDDVDSARVKAPVDGVITDVKGAAGAPPPPGAIIQMRTNALQGEFLIGETDLASLTPGLDATATIPVLSKSLPVKIGDLPKDPTQTSAAAASGTGLAGGSVSANQGAASFALLVPLPETENIRPGLTARLVLIPQRRENVVVVPAIAIVGEGSKAQVEVSVEGRNELRSVKIGLSDGRNVEILDGISEGDEVVLNPSVA